MDDLILLNGLAQCVVLHVGGDEGLDGGGRPLQVENRSAKEQEKDELSGQSASRGYAISHVASCFLFPADFPEG